MCSCYLHVSKRARAGAEGRRVDVYQTSVTGPACYVSREELQEVSLRGTGHAFDLGRVLGRLWRGLGLRSGPKLAQGRSRGGWRSGSGRFGEVGGVVGGAASHVCCIEVFMGVTCLSASLVGQ